MWKRWTICLVLGHKHVKVPYNQHDDSGTFLRCLRCGHDKEVSGSIRPTGIG